MMKYLLAFVTFLIIYNATAQENKYKRVKIELEGKNISTLAEAGIAIDHGEHRQGVSFISDLSVEELKIVEKNNFKYEVLINDVVSHYKNQSGTSSRGITSDICNPAKIYRTPVNFSLGSMGGYLTYTELLQELDKMKSLFPNLITTKQGISANDTTIEGRPIYWVKISDNPGNDETEPEMLYTALHHAREAASMQQLVFYMYYLLENYSTDAEIKALVDNTEMYFIPCINPDGYIYNEIIEPNGGGMWRKNRRDNGDGSFGVDLNRNYDYKWGFNNNGSSPNSYSDVYRGTSGFSEPETQAMRNFCISHDFKAALNYHTFGNVLIYPWGYASNTYTVDDDKFMNFADLLTEENNYLFGTANQTVGYNANGNSDDWMYGEQSLKPKIYAMTPESGIPNYGFWPPSQAIVPICGETMAQNLNAAKIISRYAEVDDFSTILLENQTGYFSFKIKRYGLDSTGNFTVSITPVSSNIASVGNSITFNDLDLFEELVDSISYSLISDLPNGTSIKYLLSVNNGLYISSDTITKVFGTPTIALNENGNSLTNWTNNGWSLTSSDFHSDSLSITDSPSGNYSNSSQKDITSNTIIDLTSATGAYLSFWAKWNIEENYDYAQVLVSDIEDGVWIPLCGKYTKAGDDGQDFGNPIYDGIQSGWVQEEINLQDFLGKRISVRILFFCDDFGNSDGFYFDDLQVKVLEPSIGISEKQKPIFLSECYPNPAKRSTTISFDLHDTEQSSLIFSNAIGQSIKKEIISGKGSITINLSDLKPGIYFYHIEKNGKRFPGKKLVILNN